MYIQSRITPTLSSTPGTASGNILDPSQLKCVEQTIRPSAFFDLIIIGSGPAALALITRILEARPAALYTEDEHRHLHWLAARKTGGLMGGKNKRASIPLIKTKKTGRGAEKAIRSYSTSSQSQAEPICPCLGQIKILVLDRLGKGWMGLWKALFNAYDIKHLRSPLFFHPDPSDLDSLLAFAQRNGRSQCGDADSLLQIFSEKKDSVKVKKVSRRIKRKFSAENVQMSDCSRGEPSLVPNSTEADLIEIPGVVGKEISKHKMKMSRTTRYARLVKDSGPAVNERDRKDYFTPSTKLFEDFITTDVTKRYGLSESGDTWQDAKGWLESHASEEGQGDDDGSTLNVNPVTTLKGEVEEMIWADNLKVSSPDDDLHSEHQGFLLRLTDGSLFGSRVVVSAVGPGGVPAVPDVLLQAESQPTRLKSFEQDPGAISPQEGTEHHGGRTVDQAHSLPAVSERGWLHSSALAKPMTVFPNPTIQRRIRSMNPTTLVVIGGGLTSAQIVTLGIKKGFQKVVLLLRGHLKVKPFDIGLEWMGRYSNLSKMQFWQNDDPCERLHMLRSARGGGSITPTYAKLLNLFVQQGKLEIRTFTEITSATWKYEVSDPEEGSWELDLACRKPMSAKERAKEAERIFKDAAEAGSETDQEGNEDKYDDRGRDQSENQDKKEVEVGDEDEGQDGGEGEDRDEGEGQAEDQDEGEKPQDKGTHEDEPTKDGKASVDQKVVRESLKADFVISATGPRLGFSSLPFMQKVFQTHPVREEGGLPVLTEDLKFGQLPLYCVGAYSALQIGPAAFNLGGMREAADRVANHLERQLGESAASDRGSTVAEGLRGSIPVETSRGRTKPKVSENVPFTHFGFEALSIEG
ncbi:hypothetical protein IE53DRAFT_242698 [Violaceomyces palustris]|uniref:Uncharacterized protein n=1 Tax=Violaceomyces palustris TaxID=1673888 RepID=A0ACD0P486_9BASI|nr:hypothetical protein IE53DRAFT_242698 [Violaceomyces palustris]